MMKKTLKKTLCVLLAVIMAFPVYALATNVNKSNAGAILDVLRDVTSVASTTEKSEDSLKVEITTNKEKYSTLGTAEFTVKITNTGSEIVNNISAEALFSDLLPVSKKSTTSIDGKSLAPNKSTEFSYKATLNTNNENLNWFQWLWLIIVRFFSGSVSTGANGFEDGRVFFDVEKAVAFGKIEVTNVVRVWVDGENISANDIITIDQEDFTTTENRQTITGSIITKENIDSIEYNIYADIDEGDISEEGKAAINGAYWKVEGLVLKPENNKIVVTAKTKSGKTQNKEINIFYDYGNIYQLDVNHVAVDDDTKISYVNNIILIFFEDDVTESRKNEIVKSINGQVVGQFNGINQYQVKIPSKTLTELKNICDDLMCYDEIWFANYDGVVETDSTRNTVSITDPWSEEGTELWDEINPSGNNWWAEAINLRGAWSYNNYFSKINLGIVDDGFDNTHEDLKDEIKFPNNASKLMNRKANHGTHVAGIMGATPNNGKGITGIVWDKNLYCCDWKATGWQAFWGGFTSEYDSDTMIYAGLIYNVEAKAKVINFSLGTNPNILAGLTQKKLDNRYMEQGKSASVYMASLLKQKDKYDDFIVVQSAGNGVKDTSTGLMLGIDVKYNGYFCSITEENCVVTNSVTKEDILNRVIRVANIMRMANGEYWLSSDSNSGELTDIAAPGTNIYSTLAGIKEEDNGYIIVDKNQKYGNLSGTSMAAPIVAGVAGLVWSVNSNFSGAEVKKIVCDSFDKDIEVIDNIGNFGPYRMINAELAVKKAVDETYPADKFGEIDGVAKDKDTQEPIADVIIKAYKNNVEIAQTYTQADGSFYFMLPEGKYYFFYSHDDYVTMSSTYTVTADVYTVLGSIFLRKKDTQTLELGISGQVVNKDTNATLYGVIVEVFEAGKTDVVAFDITSANGNFSVPLETGGSYDVRFTLTDYEPLQVENVVVGDGVVELGAVQLTPVLGSSIFAGGDGSEENPYQIETAEQLNAIRNDLTASYKLIDDVDLINWSNWKPIGNNRSSAFSGVFDGNGYTINNMTVSIESNSESIYAGFFGYVYDGEIKNLYLTNSNVTAVYNSTSSVMMAYSGGIAGYISNSLIKNCYNTGKVDAFSLSSLDCAGGIAGCVDSNSTDGSYVAGCNNYGSVNATFRSGGISGYTNYYSILESCCNYGNVSSYSYSGGITGEIRSNSLIKNCCNHGDVKSSLFAGGISGYCDRSSFKNCYNKGNIVAISTDDVSSGYGVSSGGIAGSVLIPDSIESCHNTGNVSALSSSYYAYSGGIIGRTWGTTGTLYITKCFNFGEISAISLAALSAPAGGIIGSIEQKCSLDNCYNFGAVSSTYHAGGIAGYIGASNTITIKTCYNAGSATSDLSAGGIAGVVGYGSTNNFSTEECYYTNIFSKAIGTGDSEFINVQALTDTQMKQQSSFVGFDFDTVWGISPTINNGYPYLIGVTPQ